MAIDASTSTPHLTLLSASDDPPQSPHISYGELFEQFKADVYGKEVQSAATYSYMWMADQMGHVCLGIILNLAITAGMLWLKENFGWPSFAEIAGLIATIALVATWEASTFFSAERGATGLFPLGRKLLRDNAIIATAYMALGAFIVFFGFYIDLRWTQIAAIIACTIVAVWLAPGWLRQKIIWQKAALPYLSRLADMERTMGENAARKLQELIDAGAPPRVNPVQVIIGGPIGSGRTQLAAGVGTEFAFKKAKTRYISIQSLLEFASAAKPPNFPDDRGPRNVNYWPWSEAQVIIIDDVGPLITPQRNQHQDILQHFRGILDDELRSIAPVLARCHTIWVIGDLCPTDDDTLLVGNVLDQFALAVSDYTQGQEKPLVIELKARPPAGAAAGDGAKPEAAARYVSTARSDGGDAMAEISKAVGSGAAR
jgi:hypothetical protein